MTTKKTGSRKPKKGRNAKGQWLPGVCGNKKGRGAKKKPLPKCLSEQLADAMAEKVAVTDAGGKQRMVSAYEAASRQLVQSIPELKPKELISALQWMQELHVFAFMRQRAEEAAADLPTNEDLKLFKEFKKVKKQIEEKAAADAADREKAQEPKPTLQTKPQRPCLKKPRRAA